MNLLRSQRVLSNKMPIMLIWGDKSRRNGVEKEMRGDRSFLGILPSEKSQDNFLEIKRDHAGYMISKGVDELWQANLRPVV